MNNVFQYNKYDDIKHLDDIYDALTSTINRMNKLEIDRSQIDTRMQSANMYMDEEIII